MNEIFKVGDTVLWRGDFGTAPAKPAKIVAMQICEMRRSKYGVEAESARWDQKDYVVVDLDTGNWAYGEQLSPL